MRSIVCIVQHWENELDMSNRFTKSLRKLWGSAHQSRFKARTLPPITFPTINNVEKPPRNHEIASNSITVVVPGRRPKWAMFRCPCGCQTVITLPLQSTHRPYWIYRRSKEGRPTLQPSIWRDVGCLSHFILEDGRVYWCNETGISPEEAKRRASLFSSDPE